jgi:uncharacterized phage-associated protein
MDDVETHHTAALSLQLLKQISTRLERYSAELLVDQHRQEQDSWIAKARERFRMA